MIFQILLLSRTRPVENRCKQTSGFVCNTLSFVFAALLKINIDYYVLLLILKQPEQREVPLVSLVLHWRWKRLLPREQI